MSTQEKFSIDDVDYTVKLVGGMSIVFTATVESDAADGTWWDDELTVTTTEIVGGTKNPLKVYSKLAEAVRNIIYSNNLSVCHFTVEDDRRADIYERFAKTVIGYTYQRIDKLFYLFKE